MGMLDDDMKTKPTDPRTTARMPSTRKDTVGDAPGCRVTPLTTRGMPPREGRRCGDAVRDRVDDLTDRDSGAMDDPGPLDARMGRHP